MRLLHKELDLEHSEILYHHPFTSEVLERDFEIRAGDWHVEDGWLIGKNPENFAAMVISKQNFFGNVMLDFKAATIPPVLMISTPCGMVAGMKKPTPGMLLMWPAFKDGGMERLGLNVLRNMCST